MQRVQARNYWQNRASSARPHLFSLRELNNGEANDDGLLRGTRYVAYTATPFANVLIDHEAQDREHGDDLYLKDFILSLRHPTGYVGSERLLGRDALPGKGEGIDALDVIEEVPEHEADLLTPKARGTAIVDVQPSSCYPQHGPSRHMEFELLVDPLNAFFREPLEVRVLNSTSDEVLDYTTEPNLKAVFVGGNRL